MAIVLPDPLTCYPDFTESWRILPEITNGQHMIQGSETLMFPVELLPSNIFKCKIYTSFNRQDYSMEYSISKTPAGESIPWQGRFWSQKILKVPSEIWLHDSLSYTDDNGFLIKKWLMFSGIYWFTIINKENKKNYFNFEII
jgi:hypothetical protein